MASYDLSIVIPARNEKLLNRTLEDIIKNKRGKTEVIVGLDGAWPMTPLQDHPDVTLVKYPESIGQRAITNRCVSLSKAKYVMKLDAHCAIDEGMDVKMMADMQDDWTMAPAMRNLHVFNWVCPDGHKRYQGPAGPCQCGKPTTKEIVWIPKCNPTSSAYRFDKNLHFQYWREYKMKHPEPISESLSLQGSCFMLTREKYWELDICDEQFGSWGQQGVEVAVKTWLSGGKVMINKKTWYAHLFRTQKGFKFPYPLSEGEIERARQISRDMLMGDKWPKAKYSFDWLIKRFRPPQWTT